MKADRLAPSKYLSQLIKTHYKRFAQKLAQREAPKRVQALTKMRKEMQRRYMLVYRHFRLKKHGEPLPLAPGANQNEGEDAF